MNMLLNLSFSFFVFIISAETFAASCCGGGFALPSLITSDDRAQITTSISQGSVKADVTSGGVWYKRNYSDQTQIYKIEAAHILADTFQVGVTLPAQMRTRQIENSQQSSTGLADISAAIGYEFLPDWNYNPYRPKGIGFISLTLPTGKSIYESSDGVDSRGRGFFAIGAGAVFTKTWKTLDAHSSFELHRSFDKVTSNENGYGNIKPGFGSSFTAGLGYNRGDYRLGGSLTWNYEQAVETEGFVNSISDEQKFATANAVLSYMANESWSYNLTIADQTLFGNPQNTTLSQSVSLSLQKRWSR
jgi:hypothetical protein